jgi:hypothetical protein
LNRGWTLLRRFNSNRTSLLAQADLWSSAKLNQEDTARRDSLLRGTFTTSADFQQGFQIGFSVQANSLSQFGMLRRWDTSVSHLGNFYESSYLSQVICASESGQLRFWAEGQQLGWGSRPTNWRAPGGGSHRPGQLFRNAMASGALPGQRQQQVEPAPGGWWEGSWGGRRPELGQAVAAR